MTDKSTNNQNKSSFEIPMVIMYIVIFVAVNILQGKIPVGEKNVSIIPGICTQLLTLFSAFMVVSVPRFGYFAAVLMNGLSAILLIFQISKSGISSKITGLISTIAAIILITIIHAFYKKLLKNNKELLDSNNALREKDEKLTYLAYYDILTGLPNRQMFIERIDEAISSNASFTVIAANIDNFKEINNKLGNNAGDAVLCSYSKKLKKMCGNSKIHISLSNEKQFAVAYVIIESEN